MRYCKKTKEVIKSSYLSASITEIQQLVTFAGLRKRSINSITKYVDDLILQDVKREERRKKLETWALANPIKYRARTLLAGAKSRAKSRNNDFDLTEEWLLEKLKDGCCEMTGIPFYIKPYTSRAEYRKVNPHSPSLDQILPGSGYTIGNVQVVCDQVNKFKGDRHTTSMVMVAKSFLKEYEKKNTPVITVKGLVNDYH